jgi:hypothetical protein
MPTEDNVKFINVDVILAGEVDSKPLLGAFGDGVVVLHEDGPLVLELANVGLDLHETLSRFVELVSALPRKARTSWAGASRRVFDIGIQAGLTPHETHWSIPSDLIAALAKIGGEVVLTVYGAKWSRTPTRQQPRVTKSTERRTGRAPRARSVPRRGERRA